MKKFKILAAAAAAVMAVTSLTGCSMFSTAESYTGVFADYDFSQMDLVQLRDPEEGQPTAIIKTTKGDITAVLYPEYAPNTVANFIARAEEGYYNDTNVFAVLESYYFLAGSDDPDGHSGVTSDGQPIANECTVNLHPFTGALLGYREEYGYSDSRFMVCGTIGDDQMTEENFDIFREQVDEDGNRIIPEEFIDAWKEKGGLPGFSGMFTVFGQIIDGWDVMNSILGVPVEDESSYKPVDEIKIISIEIGEYHKEA